MPIVMPPPPPPRTPIAAPERSPPGLHIGTLEVRIAAPAPALPRVRLAATAPRARGARVNGIARGFSVFGLGQS
jgi:hypothetical protein